MSNEDTPLANTKYCIKNSTNGMESSESVATDASSLNSDLSGNVKKIKTNIARKSSSESRDVTPSSSNSSASRPSISHPKKVIDGGEKVKKTSRSSTSTTSSISRRASEPYSLSSTPLHGLRSGEFDLDPSSAPESRRQSGQWSPPRKYSSAPTLRISKRRTSH